MNRHTWNIWRPFVFSIGLVAAGLSCYGAWEYALKLEGGKVSYLVLAAPFIVAAAAFFPPVFHWAWDAGSRLRAILVWPLVVAPAAVVAFYAAAERVHYAKSGSHAERQALVSAADRARKDLEDAKSAARQASSVEARFNGVHNCGPQCRNARETASLARQRVAEAEQRLTAADAKAVQEAPYQMPPWLLPVALDLTAFIGIWMGLGGPWRERVATTPRKVRRKRKATQHSAKPRKLVIVSSNDNVVRA